MVTETVIAFLLGLVAGVVTFALVLPALSKRTRLRHHVEIDRYERELSELRQERADDRETNRRLRHQLAISTPHSLQATREERDRALDELDKLHTELHHATSELAARDRSLREARLAIHDIRVQLERDRFAMTDEDRAGGQPDGAPAAHDGSFLGDDPVVADGETPRYLVGGARPRYIIDGDTIDGDAFGSEMARIDTYDDDDGYGSETDDELGSFAGAGAHEPLDDYRVGGSSAG